MPKSEVVTPERVREIGLRLCAFAGRQLRDVTDVTPEALRDVAYDCAGPKTPDGWITVDPDDPVASRQAHLSEALERCADELQALEVGVNLADSSEAATELERWHKKGAAVEQSLDAASKHHGTCPEHVAAEADLLHAVRRARAELQTKLQSFQRQLADRLHPPDHPKIRVERGAFFPNLAQDLAAAGLSTSEICDVLGGRIKGPARRDAKNRIRKYAQAKPDTMSFVVNLGDLSEEEYEAALAEFDEDEMDLSVSRMG